MGTHGPPLGDTRKGNFHLMAKLLDPEGAIIKKKQIENLVGANQNNQKKKINIYIYII